MYEYSAKSAGKLDECHIDLQTIFNEVIKLTDNTIIEGHRGKEAQNAYFDKGTSKLKYPQGKHNKIPSQAVDSAPYPELYSSSKKCYFYAGLVMGVAQRLYQEGRVTYKLRWGGDWDSDHNLSDQTFNDLVHFELIIP